MNVPSDLNSSAERIRVLLADDHTLVRAGIRALLEQLPGIEVVGEASTGREAIEQAEALAPDVVLLDIRMPVMDGVKAAERLSGQCKVMMLTYSDDEPLLEGWDTHRAFLLGFFPTRSPGRHPRTRPGDWHDGHFTILWWCSFGSG